MQQKFTFKRIPLRTLLFATFSLLLSFTSINTFAQIFCANETALFTENFGTGTAPVSNADVLTNSLTYQATGELFNEGVYRVINNTQQKPDWHNSPDHTGNTEGRMLVVNGNGNSFYRHVVNSPSGFTAGYYSASMYFMNVNRDNLCGAALLLPVISFKLEYQAEDNSWVELTGSPVEAAPVPITPTPVWVLLGGVFTLPTTGNFIVHNVRLTLSDGVTGGCGNDYAVDDIKLATCPSGGPLPVEFLNVSAKQKGAGVAVNWSTATEINNKYFDVEKSIDGGANWTFVTTAKTGGNSSVVKLYNAYDARPASGLNYYRIKQVDLDGKYKYSLTVYVKINVDKTNASVVTNPFINNIAVDFLSKSNQSVTLTLSDVTGKRVATERWVIPKGSSRKTFEKVGAIQKGMYVLTIMDENGELLYNGKLMRQ